MLYVSTSIPQDARTYHEAHMVIHELQKRKDCRIDAQITVVMYMKACRPALLHSPKDTGLQVYNCNASFKSALADMPLSKSAISAS